MADRLKKIEGQGHEHLCHTGMSVRNGNQLALTEIQQQRLQVCENNWVRQIAKSNEGRQAKNSGVKGRDGSAEELDREADDEHIAVGWTRRKDGG